MGHHTTKYGDRWDTGWRLRRPGSLWDRHWTWCSGFGCKSTFHGCDSSERAEHEITSMPACSFWTDWQPHEWMKVVGCLAPPSGTRGTGPGLEQDQAVTETRLEKSFPALGFRLQGQFKVIGASSSVRGSAPCWRPRCPGVSMQHQGWAPPGHGTAPTRTSSSELSPGGTQPGSDAQFQLWQTKQGCDDVVQQKWPNYFCWVLICQIIFLVNWLVVYLKLWKVRLFQKGQVKVNSALPSLSPFIHNIHTKF